MEEKEKEEKKREIRERIARVSHDLYESNLVRGRGGNISHRLGESAFYITPHHCSLKDVNPDDLILMNLEGKVLEGSLDPSYETLLHMDIYRSYPLKAVIHAHPPYTIASSLSCKRIPPLHFESAFLLGDVPVIPQETPTVVDTLPVLEALRKNSIIVIKHHGIISVGETINDAYYLCDLLEESAKIFAISKLFGEPLPIPGPKRVKETKTKSTRDLFSDNHLAEMVNISNKDKELGRWGRAKDFTTLLGLEIAEDHSRWTFSFLKGRITEVKKGGEAQFLLKAPRSVWKLIFNEEINPLVAAFQGKLIIEGKLSSLSIWYFPLQRFFDLWKRIKVR
ncbi:MAG: class II aldolase/adducin family protein [bacterium]|nr:class II aldolase/adducin family protein [bacterium]